MSIAATAAAQQTSASPTISAAAGKPTTAEASRTKLSGTFDNFLKLLTTQMQYQDPLSPMDSSEFTNQLVMFSGVEQQIAQNDKLEKILAAQSATQMQAALGYIGLDVESKGDSFQYAGGAVEIGYTLEGAARTTDIAILDKDNKVVRKVSGKTTAGAQRLTWDGLDQNGAKLAAGTYKVAVGAIDADGKSVTTSTTVPGRVTGIETLNGEVTLLMGAVRVPVGTVVSARKPATSA